MARYIMEIPDDVGETIIVARNGQIEIKQGVNIQPYEEPEEQKKIKNWRANHREKYWYVNAQGKINFTVDDDDLHDGWSYESGNYFKTKEEAKFYRESLSVYNGLRAYASSCCLDWDNTKSHWYIEYNSSISCIWYNIHYFSCPGCLCFDSKEIAEEAVREVGEDRVLKYYLKVRIEDDGKRVSEVGREDNA